MNTDKNVLFNTLEGKRSEKADQMHRLFLELGVDFVTGVPCGILRHIIKNFNDDAKILHVPANRESEAVGIAAGAYLGGKTPVAYMQNSGFFLLQTTSHPFLSPTKYPSFLWYLIAGAEVKMRSSI